MTLSSKQFQINVIQSFLFALFNCYVDESLDNERPINGWKPLNTVHNFLANITHNDQALDIRKRFHEYSRAYGTPTVTRLMRRNKMASLRARKHRVTRRSRQDYGILPTVLNDEKWSMLCVRRCLIIIDMNSNGTRWKHWTIGLLLSLRQSAMYTSLDPGKARFLVHGGEEDALPGDRAKLPIYKECLSPSTVNGVCIDGTSNFDQNARHYFANNIPLRVVCVCGPLQIVLNYFRAYGLLWYAYWNVFDPLILFTTQ